MTSLCWTFQPQGCCTFSPSLFLSNHFLPTPQLVLSLCSHFRLSVMRPLQTLLGRWSGFWELCTLPGKPVNSRPESVERRRRLNDKRTRQGAYVPSCSFDRTVSRQRCVDGISILSGGGHILQNTWDSLLDSQAGKPKVCSFERGWRKADRAVQRGQNREPSCWCCSWVWPCVSFATLLFKLSLNQCCLLWNGRHGGSCLWGLL